MFQPKGHGSRRRRRNGVFTGPFGCKVATTSAAAYSASVSWLQLLAECSGQLARLRVIRGSNRGDAVGWMLTRTRSRWVP